MKHVKLSAKEPYLQFVPHPAAPQRRRARHVVGSCPKIDAASQEWPTWGAAACKREASKDVIESDKMLPGVRMDGKGTESSLPAKGQRPRARGQGPGGAPSTGPEEAFGYYFEARYDNTISLHNARVQLK